MTLHSAIVKSSLAKETTSSLQYPDRVKKDEDSYDVIVIGAGTAGLFSAIAARKQGLRVILLDKQAFPRHKVCGGCLNQVTLGHMKLLGLMDLLDNAKAPQYDHLSVEHTSKADLNIQLPIGRTISRYKYDEKLVEHYQSLGGIFIDQCKAYLEPLHENQAAYRFVKGSVSNTDVLSNNAHISPTKTRLFKSKVVIISDGLAGNAMKQESIAEAEVSKNSYIGIGGMLHSCDGLVDDGVIRMLVGDYGYVGLTRVEDNQINIAAALSSKTIQQHGGMRQVIPELLKYHQTSIPDCLFNARFKGVPSLTRQRHQWWAHRVLIVGDAGAYLEPFTGEGMAWASAAALLAQPYILKIINEGWTASMGRAWQKDVAQVIAPRRRVCRMIKYGLRLGPLTPIGIRVLSVIPWSTSFMARSINQPISIINDQIQELDFNMTSDCHDTMMLPHTSLGKGSS